MLVSQAFSFPAVFLNWTVLGTVLGIVFVCNPGRDGIPPRIRMRLETVLLYVGLPLAAIIAGIQLAQYPRDTDDNGQLVQYEEIAAAIRAHMRHPGDTVVMAIHPARAYAVDAGFVQIPWIREGSLAGLSRFQGVPAKSRGTNPIYPPAMAQSDIQADYMIIDIGSEKSVPGLMAQARREASLGGYTIIYQTDEAMVLAFER